MPECDDDATVAVADVPIVANNPGADNIHHPPNVHVIDATAAPDFNYGYRHSLHNRGPPKRYVPEDGTTKIAGLGVSELIRASALARVCSEIEHQKIAFLPIMNPITTDVANYACLQVDANSNPLVLREGKIQFFESNEALQYAGFLDAADQLQLEPVKWGNVEAGLGSRFEHTSELHPLTYDKAMATLDAPHWVSAVDTEHQRMVDRQVFADVPKSQLPPGTKVLNSRWSMKKKAIRDFQGRVTAKGFQQVDCVHYDEDETSAPTVSDASLRIVFLLIVVFHWYSEVVDVNATFLNGQSLH